MKAGSIATNAHAQAAGHAHAHGHAHAPGHGHFHAADHDHPVVHERAPSLLLPTSAPATGRSLLMTSALRRLAGAIGLSVLLWGAVAWSLSGTP